jgi:hypothetical protein
VGRMLSWRLRALSWRRSRTPRSVQAPSAQALGALGALLGLWAGMLSKSAQSSKKQYYAAGCGGECAAAEAGCCGWPCRQTDAVQSIDLPSPQQQPASNGLLQRPSAASTATSPSGTHATPVSASFSPCPRPTTLPAPTTSPVDRPSALRALTLVVLLHTQQARKVGMARRPESYDPEAALLSDADDGSGSSNPASASSTLSCWPPRQNLAFVRGMLTPPPGSPHASFTDKERVLHKVKAGCCCLSRRPHAAPLAPGRALPAADGAGAAAARACSGNLLRAAAGPRLLRSPALAAGERLFCACSLAAQPYLMCTHYSLQHTVIQFVITRMYVLRAPA